MTSFPVGERLSDEQLALTRRLPLKPDAAAFEGEFVTLRPFERMRDQGPLHAASNGEPVRIGKREIDAYDADALVWRYLFGGPFDSASELGVYLEAIADTPNFRAFTVFDRTTKSAIGFIAYTSNLPEHLKIELGHIWYAPVMQGTPANLESTYLLLRHAFELGYRRVEWKCDALNERSRRSALRMGFTFEGIQQSHFIIKGRNRDTAWYRMLDHEWQKIRRRLERMLYG